VTVAEAQTALDGIARRLAERFPDTNDGIGVRQCSHRPGGAGGRGSRRHRPARQPRRALPSGERAARVISIYHLHCAA